MGRKRSASRITRTVKRGKKPRGVRRGSRRGRYHTSQIKDPLAKPWLKPPVYAAFSEAPPEIQERAREKGRWVCRFVNEGRPRGKPDQYALEYAMGARIPENEIPTYQTRYRWAVRLEVFGELGLLDAPQHSAGKPQVRRVPDEENLGEVVTVGSITPEQEELVEISLFGGQLDYSDLLRFIIEHSPSGAPTQRTGGSRRGRICGRPGVRRPQPRAHVRRARARPANPAARRLVRSGCPFQGSRGGLEEG